MGALDLTFLGGFEVGLDGAPVTGFISNKARALLCYLAVDGREQSRENLATLLWGDMPHVKALISLRQALANLRHLLGEHVLVTRHTAAFDRHSAYRLDVAEFAAAVTGFQHHADFQAGRQADALYRGDFLQGFHVRDAPTFDEWMMTQREWLHRLVVELFEDQAAYYARQGEYALALWHLDRLLALEPWSEEAHRQRMLLLARLDRRSAALKQYATCRRILDAEFGVAPSAETMALYDRILRARRVPLSAACNLPAPLTPFVGREPELARLRALLADPYARLIALTGPPGVGKSRLAIEAAQRARAAFLDGVCYVSLATLASVEQWPAALAETLGLASANDPLVTVLNHLRDREMLLLLDGFERVLPAPAVDEENTGAVAEESWGGALLDMLAAAPQIKVLIISRQPLSLREAYRFPLDGFVCPPPIPASASAADLETYDAARLFLHQARRVLPDFTPTPDDAAAIADICRLVEGNPLALERAAVWVEWMSCARIVEMIVRDSAIGNVAPFC